ncbi:hypothetical protein UFOVP239_45 [uncultured Caudovirales phage]|uniref:Uncharacterized protein n=1 Tax=uncultured Caudovirales phage TaxID=2100421 RepID=A0A6J7WVD8_9CAUD|nr:hypothetical protein UFOVP239_45 [uncultured Caudovirales phage]
MSGWLANLGVYTPAVIWLVLWMLLFPIRLLVLLVLPYKADKTWHWANPIFMFFAFEETR